ncbi:MAG: SRPBCC family protein [Planctomycetota bacterium]
MQFSVQQFVNAPLSEVFRRYADFENAAENLSGITNVEILTDGPVGKGTRFKETRVMFGRESTEELEITEFEQDRLYKVEAESCGAHFQTIFRSTIEGDATRVDVDMKTRSLTLFAKLMAPLGFLMAGTMKKCVTDDIDEIKQLCESSVTQG